MMSEKRFSVRLRSECDGVVYSFFDGDKLLDVDMIVDLLNEQQATINLLLDLLYQSEATVINEYSSHIGEDMDKLDKIFKEKDIKEIERFVRGCDDE